MLVLDEVVVYVQSYLPNIAEALLVLIVGYILARLAATITAKFLGGAGLDAKIASIVLGAEKAKTVDANAMVKSDTYYFLMFFVLVAFFAALGITILADLMTGIGLFVALVIVAAVVFGLDLGEKLDAYIGKAK